MTRLIRAEHFLIAAAVSAVVVLGGCGDEPAKDAATRAHDVEQNERDELRAKVSPLYSDGKFVEAIALQERVVATDRRLHGPRDSNYAKSVSFLGWLCFHSGDYQRGESLLRDALDLQTEVHGRPSLECATILSMLGELYRSSSNYVRAEPCFLEAQEMYVQTCGKMDDAYAGNQAWLGMLYSEIGWPERAEPLLREALEIRATLLGKDHDQYANSLEQLGIFYFRQGRYAEAEPLLLDASERRLQMLGRDHLLYAESLRALGRLHLATGDLRRAQPCLWEALAIQKKGWGPRHPKNVALLCNLALAVDDLKQSISLTAEALSIALESIDRNLIGQSEQKQLGLRHALHDALSLYLCSTAQYEYLVEPAYSAWLRSKGLVTRRQQQWRRLIDDPAVRPLVDELRSTTAALAREALAPPDLERDADSRRQNSQSRIIALTTAKDRVDEELARRGTSLGERARTVEPADVQAALPEHSALVDFVVYNQQQWRIEKNDPTPKPQTEEHVGAFVVTPTSIEWIRFAPTSLINDAINDWRDGRTGPSTDLGRSTSAQAAGQWLRKVLWEPIESHLAGRKLVIVSPDGMLARLPLAALPGKQPGTYLIEDWATVVVFTPALLPAMLATPVAPAHHDLLLVGDVDYGKSMAGGDEDWQHLDGTRDELAVIAALSTKQFGPASVRVLDRSQATEQEFRAFAPRSHDLHLATHGFFAAEKFRRGLTQSLTPATNRAALATMQSVWVYHPGLKSALVLAGVNQPTGALYDGYLTADEVATLDLRKVEMCVLSACETGLGDSATGEGQLGLERAFEMAGARSVVSGLWSVPDQATRILMEQFYARLWSNDRQVSKIDALREAQLWMLREGAAGAGPLRGLTIAIDQAPLTSSRLPPLYWAGFVLSGDWR